MHGAKEWWFETMSLQEQGGDSLPNVLTADACACRDGVQLISD